MKSNFTEHIDAVYEAAVTCLALGAIDDDLRPRVEAGLRILDAMRPRDSAVAELINWKGGEQ